MLEYSSGQLSVASLLPGPAVSDEVDADGGRGDRDCRHPCSPRIAYVREADFRPYPQTDQPESRSSYKDTCKTLRDRLSGQWERIGDPTTGPAASRPLGAGPPE